MSMTITLVLEGLYFKFTPIPSLVLIDEWLHS